MSRGFHYDLNPMKCAPTNLGWNPTKLVPESGFQLLGLLQLIEILLSPMEYVWNLH